VRLGLTARSLWVRRYNADRLTIHCLDEPDLSPDMIKYENAASNGRRLALGSFTAIIARNVSCGWAVQAA